MNHEDTETQRAIPDAIRWFFSVSLWLCGENGSGFFRTNPAMILQVDLAGGKISLAGDQADQVWAGPDFCQSLRMKPPLNPIEPQPAA